MHVAALVMPEQEQRETRRNCAATVSYTHFVVARTVTVAVKAELVR